MTAPRVQCSAAGFYRDRHMAIERQYHVTDPGGQQFVFCSACCLLYYACYGLPADIEPAHSGTLTGGTAA
jgi:hypothetical protein